jgi:hypothetical protein
MGNPESFSLDHLAKVIVQMQESTPHLEISLWQAWWSMIGMMTSVLPP